MVIRRVSRAEPQSVLATLSWGNARNSRQYVTAVGDCRQLMKTKAKTVIKRILLAAVILRTSI